MMRAGETSESAGSREWGNVDALLIWLSGASPRILRQCPAERPKYTGIGSVILVTSLLAAISMGFLLHEDVGATFGWAIVLSIVWGVAIAALDRWLTVSLDRAASAAALPIPRPPENIARRAHRCCHNGAAHDADIPF